MKLKGRHKKLMVIGLLAMIAAWLSWTMLLAESDLPPTEPAEIDDGF